MITRLSLPPVGDADRTAMLLALIHVLIQRLDPETAADVRELLVRLGLCSPDHRQHAEPGADAGAVHEQQDRARYQVE
jgi:hypothetical protein